MREYNYYWYDHLCKEYIPTVIDSIEKAINNHDYNSFMFYYNHKYNGELYELPNYISTIDNNGYFSQTPLNKESFYKITYSEYECG